MEVHEAIEKRRTIRIFKKRISEGQLRKIILAGAKAPSAMNRQPWEFIIVDDQDLIDQLAELKYQQNRRLPPRHFGGGMTRNDVEERALNQKKFFQNASIVAVCNQRGQEQRVSVWLCIENMLLAAVAEGLGGGIVTYWGKHKQGAEKILGLPSGYELTAVLKFGVPGEDLFSREKLLPFAPRRPEFSWLHRNRF